MREKENPLRVSELTLHLRQLIEPNFKSVWVVGELSNFRPSPSGHVYFSLKDNQSTIQGALFGWSRFKKNLKFELEDGLEILCHGRISIYPPRGSYQLVVDHIEPLGAGALQLAFEQLKKKLEQEGLFETQKKRPLPQFPKKITVITSPTGAAIRDFIHVIQRRAPFVSVLIAPALVQGEGAPAQLIRAIETVNKHHLGDVIVLTRGGGSIEDLWCFNDEKLARTIARSKIPVVSAVGHEIDFTICDFVSDLRAPTPSAAAEILSTHWIHYLETIENCLERINYAFQKQFDYLNEIVFQLSQRLTSPHVRILETMQKFDDLLQRMFISLKHQIQNKRLVVAESSSKLDALSPLNVLQRGFCIAKSRESKKIIKSVQYIESGEKMILNFSDGDCDVQAI